jgi:hypothetical protein
MPETNASRLAKIDIPATSSPCRNGASFRASERLRLFVELACWLQGRRLLVATAAIFLVAWKRGMPEAEVRSLAFVTLVVGNIALILAGRSFSASMVSAFWWPNPVLWIVLGVDTVLLSAILSLPTLRELFRFGPLTICCCASEWALPHSLSSNC